MRFLVTGAEGRMGKAIKKTCQGCRIEYTGLGHQQLDISNHDDVSRVFDLLEPDVVLNMAAFLNRCEDQPSLAYKINSAAVLNLAKLCCDHKAIFVQASSSAVFFGYAQGVYTEGSLPNPCNTYGRSKLAGEYFAQVADKHYIVRFPWLYGCETGKRKGFLEIAMDRVLSGNESAVATDRVDSPTYAIDAAGALVSLVLDQRPYGVYHILNSGSVSIYDFISEFAVLTGSDRSKIIPAKDVDFDSPSPKPLQVLLQTTKLPQLRSWREALKSYVRDCAELTI